MDGWGLSLGKVVLIVVWKSLLMREEADFEVGYSWSFYTHFSLYLTSYFHAPETSSYLLYCMDVRSQIDHPYTNAGVETSCQDFFSSKSGSCDLDLRWARLNLKPCSQMQIVKCSTCLSVRIVGGGPGTIPGRYRYFAETRLAFCAGMGIVAGTG